MSSPKIQSVVSLQSSSSHLSLTPSVESPTTNDSAVEFQEHYLEASGERSAEEVSLQPAATNKKPGWQASKELRKQHRDMTTLSLTSENREKLTHEGHLYKILDIGMLSISKEMMEVVASSCRNLTTFACGRVSKEAFRVLCQLTSLKKIIIADASELNNEALNYVRSLSKLKKVCLWQAKKISEITPLRACTNLQSVDIKGLVIKIAMSQVGKLLCSCPLTEIIIDRASLEEDVDHDAWQSLITRDPPLKNAVFNGKDYTPSLHREIAVSKAIRKVDGDFRKLDPQDSNYIITNGASFRSLDLWTKPLSKDDFTRFCTWMTNITHLRCGRVDEEAFTRMCKVQTLKKLVIMDASQIQDVYLGLLLNLPQLHTIELHSCSIQFSTVIEVLAKKPLIRSISIDGINPSSFQRDELRQSLELRLNEDILSLFDLPNLKDLHLRGSFKIHQREQFIKKIHGSRKLKHLTLDGLNLTEEELVKISQEKLCKIRSVNGQVLKGSQNLSTLTTELQHLSLTDSSTELSSSSSGETEFSQSPFLTSSDEKKA